MDSVTYFPLLAAVVFLESKKDIYINITGVQEQKQDQVTSGRVCLASFKLSSNSRECNESLVCTQQEAAVETPK